MDDDPITEALMSNDEPQDDQDLIHHLKVLRSSKELDEKWEESYRYVQSRMGMSPEEIEAELQEIRDYMATPPTPPPSPQNPSNSTNPPNSQKSPELKDRLDALEREHMNLQKAQIEERLKQAMEQIKESEEVKQLVSRYPEESREQVLKVILNDARPALIEEVKKTIMTTGSFSPEVFDQATGPVTKAVADKYKAFAAPGNKSLGPSDSPSPLEEMAARKEKVEIPPPEKIPSEENIEEIARQYTEATLAEGLLKAQGELEA